MVTNIRVIHRLSTGYPQTYPQGVNPKMQCIKPFRPRKGVEYGCGQCRCCLVNRARTWTGRLLLEASCHVHSSFVTLTYAPEHLPEKGSLSPGDWREFSKGIGYRYFGVGEYGDHFLRPHYHLVLFGIEAPAAQQLCESRWPYGFVQALPLAPGLCRYLARYTTKKYIRPKMPPGLVPEFVRMSRRPGLGVPAMGALGTWLTELEGAQYLSKEMDVPSVMRSERAIYPLGRTIRLKLRGLAGLPDTLPEVNELRRRSRVLLLADPSYCAAVENRRVRGYERVSGAVFTRRGSL